MEFRLYNRVNSTIFDMIGKTEPDQTKGLGYVLSCSADAMERFLQLVMPKYKKEINRLMKLNYVVDCEPIEAQADHKSLRADIIICFYKEVNMEPDTAFVVEAKSTKAIIASQQISHQINEYVESFKILGRFKEKNAVKPITLTRQKLFLNDNDIVSLTWEEIIESFYRSGDNIVKEYVNYLTNIKGTMNFYEEEIITIPAGTTLSMVKDPECSMYECPVDGRQFKSRGEKQVLYFAFREGGGQHGRMTALYKVQKILSLNINNVDGIDDAYEDIKKRIAKYLKTFPDVRGQKWVFLFDKDQTIKLPYPVEYGYQTPQGTDYRTLKEFLQEPKVNEKGERVVILEKKQ